MPDTTISLPLYLQMPLTGLALSLLSLVVINLLARPRPPRATRRAGRLIPTRLSRLRVRPVSGICRYSGRLMV
ncbi:MAG: hypothetical protein R6U00_00785, partial [Prochlorococcaceae cyanobacterium]